VPTRCSDRVLNVTGPEVNQARHQARGRRPRPFPEGDCALNLGRLRRRGLALAARRGKCRALEGTKDDRGYCTLDCPDIARRKKIMSTFGFYSGPIDYWMLVTDWRNGSIAIMLVIGALIVGYAARPRWADAPLRR
jgi:hypothetical protein